MSANQRIKLKLLDVGSAVFIRTVTFYYTGKIVAIDDAWIELTTAAWIPDSGRWSEALATGTLAVVEPYSGNVLVARGAIVDVTPWTHALPTVAK